MSYKESTDEFISTTLALLNSSNLDPVIDYSEADETAQELIDRTFSVDNQGKEISVILSSSNDSGYAVYNKGGIFDHVGYGFHRYSTDADWLVPHFEKMLFI